MTNEPIRSHYCEESWNCLCGKNHKKPIQTDPMMDKARKICEKIYRKGQHFAGTDELIALALREAVEEERKMSELLAEAIHTYVTHQKHYDYRILKDVLTTYRSRSNKESR